MNYTEWINERFQGYNISGWWKYILYIVHIFSTVRHHIYRIGTNSSVRYRIEIIYNTNIFTLSYRIGWVPMWMSMWVIYIIYICTHIDRAFDSGRRITKEPNVLSHSFSQQSKNLCMYMLTQFSEGIIGFLMLTLYWNACMYVCRVQIHHWKSNVKYTSTHTHIEFSSP